MWPGTSNETYLHLEMHFKKFEKFSSTTRNAYTLCYAHTEVQGMYIAHKRTVGVMSVLDTAYLYSLMQTKGCRECKLRRHVPHGVFFTLDASTLFSPLWTLN